MSATKKQHKNKQFLYVDVMKFCRTTGVQTEHVLHFRKMRRKKIYEPQKGRVCNLQDEYVLGPRGLEYVLYCTVLRKRNNTSDDKSTVCTSTIQEESTSEEKI